MKPPVINKTENNLPNVTLYIKNMVCGRCIKVVKEEFEKLGLTIKNITLGEVVVEGSLNQTQIENIKKILEDNGLE